MSPLARSLLALAALLAAADAIANPFCDSLAIGDTSDFDHDIISFDLTATGDFYLIIPDKCRGPGSEIRGQVVSVCNTPNNKPTIRIIANSKPYSAVAFDCPGGVPGCDALQVQVEQKCKSNGLSPYPYPPGVGAHEAETDY